VVVVVVEVVGTVVGVEVEAGASVVAVAAAGVERTVIGDDDAAAPSGSFVRTRTAPTSTAPTTSRRVTARKRAALSGGGGPGAR